VSFSAIFVTLLPGYYPGLFIIWYFLSSFVTLVAPWPCLFVFLFTMTLVTPRADCRFMQGSCGSLKVLDSPYNFYSRFSKPGKSLKTDIVLESSWICVWRSLKVLEFDFFKRHVRKSDFQYVAWVSVVSRLYHLVNFSDNFSFWLMLEGVKLLNVNCKLNLLIYAYKSASLILFSSPYISFVWSLKVFKKSLNLILTNEQEPCLWHLTIIQLSSSIASYCTKSTLC